MRRLPTRSMKQSIVELSMPLVVYVTILSDRVPWALMIETFYNIFPFRKSEP